MLTEKEKKVLELRKRKMKQIEIAKNLRISQSAVSSFENNAKKKIQEAKKILEFAAKAGMLDE